MFYKVEHKHFVDRWIDCISLATYEGQGSYI